MSTPQPRFIDHFIGRFRVLSVLGRGTEGVVYLASDPELGREVAIKTPSLGPLTDPLVPEQLLCSAQTASKLSHPNIVPVFEAGMHDGAPYVVFEFVAGCTLGQVLAAAGPLPLPRALAMTGQIVDGMAYLHERNLIHGDLKPPNILVGDGDRVRVADFGLLRDARATCINQMAGTLRYLAPECFGNDGTDCRRDVYALGLLFYEMLTGEPVVPRAGGPAAQMACILNDITAPPSAVNPRVAPQIDAIVMKALSKDPAQRYASAGEMKRDLDRIRLSGTPDESVEVREATVHGTVEFLLRRMAHKSDFPALSASMRSINQFSTDVDAVSVKALSDTVVRDFALTQRLLRLVNAAAMGAGKVTKVSDAITMLGVGQLRTVAAAMMLAGGAGAKHTPVIAGTLTDAFVAGLISRNVGRISGIANVEELFICGMFSPLGELLVNYYLAEEHEEIARRIAKEGVLADAAARAVLGINFQELGIAVARHWQLPPAIIAALSPLPAGELKPGCGPAERMWQCAGYARELCALARMKDGGARAEAFEAHMRRFAPAVRIDAAMARDLMTRSIAVAGNYIAAAGFAVSRTATLDGMSELCGERKRAIEPPRLVSSTADEKTVPLAVAAPPRGWRARVARALRSVL
jgi:serine/threonine protein kinase